MNTGNSETSDHHKLLLNPLDNINLEVISMLLYQSLAITIHGII